MRKASGHGARARQAGSRVVALTSGGLDSTVLAYLLTDRGHLVYPLYVNYGHRAFPQELQHLRRALPKSLLRRLKVIDVPGMKEAMEGALFDNKGFDYWVPHRNLVLLAVAAAQATRVRAHIIAIGLIGEASIPVPDADEGFIRALSNLISKSRGSTTEIIAPLRDLTKREVVDLGVKLHVPLASTYSCFLGTLPPCSSCPACDARGKALLGRVRDGAR